MKILIIGPAWVGDMVMAQTLFTCMQQQYPQALIDVLAPDWTQPLLERMPEVNRAINMPIGHGRLGLLGRWRLAQSIRQEKYQQAIVLPNTFKSGLIPFWAKIPVRTGWRGEARSWILNDCRRLDKKLYPLMQQRFAALGFNRETELAPELPKPSLCVTPGATEKLEKKLSLKTDQKILLLCPGAEFGESKKWPEAYFSEVAGQSIKQGWQVWVLGSKNDQETGRAIVEALPTAQQGSCRNLAGLTSLGEAIDLISLATIVISNDSGLMHIAAALSKPLVVIYGSTSPDFTPPLTEQVKILALTLACRPCFKRECPLHHLQCLKEIKPLQVLNAMNELSLQE